MEGTRTIEGIDRSITCAWFVFGKWVLLSCIKFIHEDDWLSLIGINCTTFSINVVDAILSAVASSLRIPEWILHLLTILGGGPATAIMMTFGHNSSDNSYHESFCTCCFIHIIVVLVLAIGRLCYYRIFPTIRRTYKPKIFSESEHAPYRPVRPMCE